VVNEAAVRAFGLPSADQAVGKSIVTGNGGREGTIIGVVRDFHYFGLQKKVEPLVMEWNPSQFASITLNVGAANIRDTLKVVEAEWAALFPGIPFESYFLDEDFNRQYQADERLWGITRAFTGLGIMISCLGLFGLAAYLAEQRTREVGIRKVLGATTGGLVVMFSNTFIRMVLLANLLAVPVAWLVMNQWLANYAFRTRVQPWVFVLAAGLSAVIALVTVAYQSVRAALTNPAEAIRHE
jgi:putative ABC transport system permease protein